MGASNFNGRDREHEKLLKEIIKDLKTWGYPVTQDGQEVANLALELRSNTDPTALAIRFRPDINVKVQDRVLRMDAKASNMIERGPYEEYMKLADAGQTVIIVSGSGKKKCFCNIKALRLKPPKHMYWPIVDGWITPRASPFYEEYKRCYPLTGKPYTGSGTAYREFYIDGMIEWGPWHIAWFA